MYVNYRLALYPEAHEYFISQSWGDLTDIMQALAIYVVLSISVCVFCWFGQQLSQEVRKPAFFSVDFKLMFPHLLL
jgi:hypothetical protein